MTVDQEVSSHQALPARSVLLTGATGFIGRQMAALLAQRAYRVVSLQRSDVAVEGVSETIVVPVFSPDSLLAALTHRRFDWLIHLAGYGVRPNERDVASMFSMNVDVTRCLVAAAASWPAKSVFIAGSGSEYDLERTDGAITEGHPLETGKLYGASKAAAGICALAIARTTGLPLAIGRLFGIYGAHEASHRLLPSIYKALASGQRVPLSHGLQERDLLYVQDAVEAAIRLTEVIELRKTQIPVNIASGQAITVKAFAELVAEEMGASQSLLGFGDLAQRPDETKHFAGNPTTLMTLTGWRPRYDLRRGIRESLRHIQESAIKPGWTN